MREVADAINQWAEAGHDAAVARVMVMDGFGGRRAGEVWARSANGETAGVLLLGAADADLHDAAEELLSGRRGAQVVTVPVGDADAIASGLACGGVAHVLVQRASLVPRGFWNLVVRREPVVLATVAEGPNAGRCFVVHGPAAPTATGSLGSAEHDADVLIIATDQLRGKDRWAVAEATNVGRVLVEAFVPPSKMVVVGAAQLAHCLSAQGSLLGWETDIVDEKRLGGADDGVARAESLGPVDALVVLSHDIAASCGALAAALRGRCGYVGALGSRHTQAARGLYLRDTLSLDDGQVARIHGPIGLDLGSRTPEETALAIYAEILAHRSGRKAASLTGGSGPING